MTCVKKKDQQNFDDVTGHIGQVTIGSKKNPICIPGNSVITVPGAYHQSPSQGSVPGGAGRTSQPAPGDSCK